MRKRKQLKTYLSHFYDFVKLDFILKFKQGQYEEGTIYSNLLYKHSCKKPKRNKSKNCDSISEM